LGVSMTDLVILMTDTMDQQSLPRPSVQR